MGTLGKHYLLDLKDCNKSRLDDLEFIKDVLSRVATEAGTAVIGESYHRFEPQGMSGAVLITGAHICVHTWPEYGYAAVDIFTCGDGLRPADAVSYLIKQFQSKTPSVVEMKRGIISPASNAKLPHKIEGADVIEALT